MVQVEKKKVSNHISYKNIDGKISSVMAWGWNNKQLGLDVEDSVVGTPKEIDSEIIKEAKIISCGGSHNAFITHDDKLYLMGQNQNGQLGFDSKELPHSVSPVELKLDIFVDDPPVDVSCGDRHTVVVTKKGKVFSFGCNFNGQLGLNHNGNVSGPQEIIMLHGKKIRHVYCGSKHTLFLSKKGRLFSCGYGSYGQLGHNNNVDVNYPKLIEEEWSVIAISVKEHMNVVLTSNFEMYQWGGKRYVEGKDDIPGGNNSPKKVLDTLGGRRIQQVRASAKHCLARTKDGSVFGWGHSLESLGYMRYLKNIEYNESNENNKKTNSEKELLQQKLDLSKRFVLTQNEDFTVYKNHFFSEEKIIDIACGETTNFALTESGKVYSWGRSNSSELGLGKDKCDIPEQITSLDGVKVKKIVAGGWHCLAFCE